MRRKRSDRPERAYTLAEALAARVRLIICAKRAATGPSLMSPTSREVGADTTRDRLGESAPCSVCDGRVGIRGQRRSALTMVVRDDAPEPEIAALVEAPAGDCSGVAGRVGRKGVIDCSEKAFCFGCFPWQVRNLSPTIERRRISAIDTSLIKFPVSVRWINTSRPAWKSVGAIDGKVGLLMEIRNAAFTAVDIELILEKTSIAASVFLYRGASQHQNPKFRLLLRAKSLRTRSSIFFLAACPSGSLSSRTPESHPWPTAKAAYIGVLGAPLAGHG